MNFAKFLMPCSPADDLKSHEKAAKVTTATTPAPMYTRTSSPQVSSTLPRLPA